MAAQPTNTAHVEARSGILEIVEILGGKRVLKKTPVTKMEVHDTILKGISCRALFNLFKDAPLLPKQ